MKMLEIAVLPNGAHKNQTYHGTLPNGWALLPTDELENFPFGEVEVDNVDDLPTVIKWTPGEVPDSGTTDPTSAQLREEAYDTRPVIEWDGELLTVTAAAQLWQYYAAEGSVKADELQALIAQAKAAIRVEFPEEVSE